MKRIDNRTVILSTPEAVAQRRFEELLDDGYGIRDAVLRTFEQYPSLSVAFYDWLCG